MTHRVGVRGSVRFDEGLRARVISVREVEALDTTDSSLALGIGANTATYSASNTYVGNPVSLPEADRVLMVLNLAPGQTEGWSEVSPADFLDWRAQSRSFDSFA